MAASWACGWPAHRGGHPDHTVASHNFLNDAGHGGGDSFLAIVADALARFAAT